MGEGSHQGRGVILTNIITLELREGRGGRVWVRDRIRGEGCD